MHTGKRYLISDLFLLLLLDSNTFFNKIYKEIGNHDLLDVNSNGNHLCNEPMADQLNKKY